MPVTNSQKSYLRSRANALKPFVMIGKEGLKPTIIQAIDKNLELHELVKIKFQDFQDEKQTIMDEICLRTNGMLVDIIGNNALIYRENPDPLKRVIHLPA